MLNSYSVFLVDRLAVTIVSSLETGLWYILGVSSVHWLSY